MENFRNLRRQRYIDEESYENTLKHFDQERVLYEEMLDRPEVRTGGHATALMFHAIGIWRKFQIGYTAGAPLEELARSLNDVVEAFDSYVKKNNNIADFKRRPAFRMVDSIDTYTNILHLASALIMLHREDLLPIVLGWIRDDEYGGVDAVLEELFNFYFDDTGIFNLSELLI